MILRLMTDMGRDPHKTQKYAAWLRELGFGEVRNELSCVPSNPHWPVDPRQKELGALEMQNMMWLIDSFFKPLEQMKWSKEDSERFVADAKRDLQDPEIHVLFPL